MKTIRASLIVMASIILPGLGHTSAQQPSSAPSMTESEMARRPYSMLYVFGDSYSDSGSGYLDSNGPTAVAYLAQRLHIPFTYFGDPNSKGKGLNFAVSGAKSGAGEGIHYEHGEMLSLGMMNQVDEFDTLLKFGAIKFDPKQTMFFFAGGLNDRPLADGVTVANIEAEIENLYALGARRFMVALLPVKIPSFASAGQRFNPQLTTIPADMRSKHPDIEISNSNWGMFFDEVIENPAKYGITDITSKCAGRVLRNEDPTPCASPETHYFYHGGHPSTAVHKAVGDMLFAEAMKQ
jgi:phospholipase/lecithinase/hemolysin